MKIAISVSESEKAKGRESPYFRALVESGAAPEELALIAAKDSHGLRVEAFGGILLSGGADVDPAYYDEQPKYANVHVDHDRDEFERAWLDRAMHLRLPVLGICRGAQVVNVKFDGTLHQDLEKDWAPEDENTPAIRHKQTAARSETTHSVTITDPGSRLAQVVQGNCRVNSMHHQGIKILGHGLKATAHAEDGLVEALELPESGQYLVAVQWHPEELTAIPQQKTLFQQFLAECRQLGTGNREQE